ncbi:MAG: hypothetical protein NTX85_01780 [Candidatus Nomurabacteria bacterium]|nr:hypothetical protein [Candidatus Nomurabacteria bacterium]
MKKSLIIKTESNFVRELLLLLKYYDCLTEADEILSQIGGVGRREEYLDAGDEKPSLFRSNVDMDLEPFVLEAILLNQIKKSDFFSVEIKFNYKNSNKILNELDSKTEFTGIGDVEDFLGINNFSLEIETKEVFFIPIIRTKNIKDIKKFISDKGFEPLGTFELLSYLGYVHSLRKKSNWEKSQKLLPKAFHGKGVPIIAIRDILLRSHKQSYQKSVLLSAQNLYHIRVRSSAGGFNKIVYVICEKKK